MSLWSAAILKGNAMKSEYVRDIDDWSISTFLSCMHYQCYHWYIRYSKGQGLKSRSVEKVGVSTVYQWQHCYSVRHTWVEIPENV